VGASPEITDGLRKTLRKTRTALLAPMRRSGEVFGALGVGAKLSGGSFEEDDRQFCMAAAERAAVAVETLLLRRRGQDVDRALEIQRHLLPKELPRIDGYDVAASWQPSGTVAGDYYDVLRLDPGRTGLCIADAAGKGMPAALLMSNLQAAVRALAPGAESPSELCRSLNQVLSGSIAGGTFFTFFYAELDHGNGSLRYSNAGHNPPILLRRDGTVERLTTGGMVLGAFAGRRYEDHEVRIAPGDTLLLFTDGITEAMNASGEEFGEERLLEVMQAGGDLGAEEIEAAVMAAVRRFSPGEFGDDATILVLSVRDPGP
jgi:sigma-B regulation protein RsbU (phosphoserine phosphatase)